MSVHSYLVPDYYPDFICKGGECVHTCCSGWRITLSMDKYFKLLGLGCSPELRGRLDRAFCICDCPTPEKYAQIVPNYEGDCPLHNERGLCALQLERGAGVLTEACRYYPRSMRSEYRYECSCANSCEGVVEMLLSRREPIKFRRMRLSFRRDALEPEHCPAKGAGKRNALRGECVAILQDRAYPFAGRMIRLGSFISALGWEEGIKVPASSLPEPLCSGDDRYALKTLNYLMSCFEEAKPGRAVREYFAEARSYLGLSGEIGAGEIAEAAEKYRAARKEFGREYPDCDIMAEQIMVNHVFYVGFPCRDGCGSPADQYAALAVVYAFVRLLSVCSHAVGGGLRKITDAIAAAFRLIEHSGFDRNAAIFLRRIEGGSPERLVPLLLV